MAKLDSDDLDAIKDLIEVTVEEVIERDWLQRATLAIFRQKTNFMAGWMKLWESVKQFGRNSQCKVGLKGL
jgi:hypothetical protein